MVEKEKKSQGNRALARAIEAGLNANPDVSRNDLAAYVGVSPQAVAKWLKDGKISKDNLNRVAECLDADPGALATEYRYRAAKHTNVGTGPAVTTEVPLISWVQAGQWNSVEDIYDKGDGEKYVSTTARVSSSTYALRVRGDSMESPFGKSYPDGCIIIVDPRRAPENGSKVIVRLDDDQEATFKQYVRDGERVYLKPLNPRYPMIEIDKDATFCGVVVQTWFDEDY